MNPIRINERQSCRGATLMEVLIAAVIIGIGLLGIASLQVKALQASSVAQQRATATDLAWALADRMRANLHAETPAGNDYVSDPIVGACPDDPPNNIRCAMFPGEADTSGVTQCDAAQMAAYDLYVMRCAPNLGVKRILPAGRLAITCDDLDNTNADTCDPGSELFITVSWDTRENIGNTNSPTESVSMGVVPGFDPLF